MKRIIPILVSVMILVAFVSAGRSQVVINGNAASPTVAIPVGTSTPVTILPLAPVVAGRPSRCNWAINWTEAGDMVCLPIISGTSPIFAPDTTHGFKMTSAKAPWTDTALNGDPSLGWQCVSTSGTLNIYVLDNRTCLRKGSNP